MALRFYNTLTQQVEEFAPADGRTVRMYTCGPTVYNYVHIGNLRTFLFQDLLRRWLRAHGWALDHVMNITDVEDKIIRDAGARGVSIREFTAQYEAAFFEDVGRLRLEKPERLVRATEHVPDMVRAIEKLHQKGCTYQSDGSTYFRISSFPEYGKLSHFDFSGIRAGARVDVDEYEKDDARDFVLWKAKKEGEPPDAVWPTSFGDGRPGWHIECSVMAMKYLGETIDIHTGGIDLAFPHHENEIAQSESLTGRPFSRFWLHAEHLMVEGKRMAKSLGNFFTLRDLLAQGYPPETIRYLLASVPYRKKLNFTFDGLTAARSSVERLRDYKLRLETGTFPDGAREKMSARAAAAESAFVAALDDDLNTAEALAAVFEFVRDSNAAMDAGEFGRENARQALAFLSRFDTVFDVLRPASMTPPATLDGNGAGAAAAAAVIGEDEIELRIAERLQAKKSRDFQLADRIRTGLLERGVVLEDTREGVRWKRK